MKESKKGLVHLLLATRYSIAGLRLALRELAFRQEILLGVLHFILLAILRPSIWTALVLTLVWFAILIVELLNTAIEAVVDLASPDLHKLAKKAKDTASAAVFLSVISFFVSWAVVVLL